MSRKSLVLFLVFIFVFPASLALAKTLRVGCDIDVKPFVFKDEQGKISGFEIDLWQALAKDNGLEYKLVPMKFGKLLPALEKGKIDVAIAAITINSERAQKVDFSFPYFESGLQLAVRHDDYFIETIGDLLDKKVGTKAGTTSATFVESIQTKGVTTYTTIHQACEAMLAGKIDAVFFDSPTIEAYVEQKGENKVKTVGPRYQRQFYGLALQQNSPLKEQLDISLLKYMEAGFYDITFRRWFGYVPQ